MRCWILLVALCACARDTPRATRIDPDAPVRVLITTPTGDAVVTVELAETAAKVKRGLSGRRELAADAGMLFFMGRDHNWSFWMKDTFIPLDIVFITRELTIAGIVPRAVPEADTPLYVGANSLYVLEVNGGWAAKHGVTAGAKVRFENVKL